MHTPHCLGRPSGANHTTPLKCCTLCLFHNVTCYTNSIVSHIHATTIDLRNITCTWITPGYDTTELKSYNIIDCVFTLDNAAGGPHEHKRLGPHNDEEVQAYMRRGGFYIRRRPRLAEVGPIHSQGTQNPHAIE